MRSPNWRMIARCFATAGRIATYEAGTKSDNEVVEMMIGREYSHVFPPKPAAPAATGTPVLEVRNLVLDAASQRHLLQRPGRRGGRPRRSRRAGAARAAAGAVRRAARDQRPDPDRRQAGQHRLAARGEGRRHRHGADSGGSQDRGPDAADVGAGQSVLCDAVGTGAWRHHRPRRGTRGRRRDDQAARPSRPTASRCRPARCPAAISRSW